MPINAYTGLMGSGKSFECVVSVILPAILAGRNVVTNVDGIDSDAIRAYLVELHNLKSDVELGVVRHCSNDEVSKPEFLPFGEDVDTFCQPGEIVCIDEAWRFWGPDCKLLPQHKIFFREHRHYVDPVTKVCSDLVLMVQDITDLHRVLKVVVELTFRTTKIKSLGLDKVYRVEMWEGYKLAAKTRSSVQNKKYNASIFPLYSSYTGGSGSELRVDARQNLLASKTLWFYLIALVVASIVAVYGVKRFFGQPTKPVSVIPSVPVNTPGRPPGMPFPVLSAQSPTLLLSDKWRIAGIVEIGNTRFVVLSSSSGLRYESPSKFTFAGPATFGVIDGAHVTYFTGSGRAASNVLPGTGVQ